MNKLAELRYKKGMTQYELAEALGTNRSNVYAWEHGTRTPKPAMMQRMEDFFKVPKERIFFEAFDYSK